MRRLECRQRTNSDVWIHHVACKFPWFFYKPRHYTVIGNQLFISNDRNRVRWVVLGLLQDGACTDFFENLSENTFKGDLSNATIFDPPLFSLVDTFKHKFWVCKLPVPMIYRKSTVNEHHAMDEISWWVVRVSDGKCQSRNSSIPPSSDTVESERRQMNLIK